MAFHRASCGQRVTLSDRFAVKHRIEHLRRQRVAFAQHRPLVRLRHGILAHSIARHHLAQLMGMRAIGKRIDGLVLFDLARAFHVFDLHGRNKSGSAQQQYARLFGHSGHDDWETKNIYVLILIVQIATSHTRLSHSLFERVVNEDARVVGRTVYYGPTNKHIDKIYIWW